MVTIAYFTNRKNPRFHWFTQSLHRELLGSYEGIRIVVVDFWAEEPGRKDDFRKLAYCDLIHVTPKPNVWQGKHRITKVDFFAAANARNTAICLAPDGWIVFVDDLSVLLPGWWNAVKDAMFSGYIVLGAYKKVKNLVVENGNIVSFEEFIPGVDSRWRVGSDNGPVIAAGSWMFGCSLAAPVEAFLKIGGFPELADSLGSEDYLAGIALEKQGFRLMYDRRMLTYESEEAHFEDPPFKRTDKGVSPNDKSHAALNMVMQGNGYFVNYYEGGIPALRQHVLSGNPFPVVKIPEHDWYNSDKICEM